MATYQMHGSVIQSVSLLAIGYLLYRLLRLGRREANLPPGPRTIPILGNAHLMAGVNLHERFKEWSEAYGPIVSLKVGSSTIVILNDPRAIHTLQRTKGAVLANRPIDEQIELATNGESMALMRNNSVHKLARKIASQILSPKNLDEKVARILEAENVCLLVDLLDQPSAYRSSIHRSTASVVSIALYGHRAPTWDSFWAKNLAETVDVLLPAIKPGSYLPTNQFPILKLLPHWCIPSRRLARDVCKVVTATFRAARELVEDRRRRGDIRDSLLDAVLDGTMDIRDSLTDSQIDNVLLGTLHQGGSETSSLATLTTLLHLAQHTKFQERARVELDNVCGVSRLPQWSDFKLIPYINCIVKEGLRIRPVIPFGIPYCAETDIWHDGVLIPKGAIVFLPIYSLNRAHHADADTYNPDRYLEHPEPAPVYALSSNYQNRDHYSYGSGRRICVGMHLAERTLWRTIASILWAFRIEPGVDERGNTIEMDLSGEAYEDGFTAAPKPFAIRLVPRSKEHVEVVRKAASDVNEFLKQWE